MKIRYIGLSVILLSWSFNAVAVCQFLSGHQQNPVNFQIPSNLSIPRDAPAGTVIFQSPEILAGTVNSSYNCSTSYLVGAKNNVGTTTPAASLFPIGNTGVSWKLYAASFGQLTGYPNPSHTSNAGTFGLNNSGWQLSLIKEKDVTGSITIPAGILGYVQLGEISPISIQINGATVIAASCTSPDNIAVDMGKYTLADFMYEAPITRWSQIGIRLTNCPQGINSVQLSLIPTASSPVISPTTGLIRLNPSSTAKGIAVQILFPDTREFNLNKKYTFTGFSSGSDIWIELRAKYYKYTAGYEIEPGTANAEIMYMIEYL
ncbi:fimbrial protein [Pseudomonas sp. A34-9]|uniref:fimbrial protein n=1 Tax=Pseudomonas sp. A34-9 TaxID=3034675 RepID=UPI00240CEEDA|nr:fimbrial protein [Pseudomonas sp. A34-9]